MWGGALWSVSVTGPVDRFGALKGTDFAQFYVAARFAASGRLASLYDWPAFAADLASSVPHSNGLLYLSVYPPQLAVLFAPLARLDYLSALLAWTAVSAALYAASIVILTSRSRELAEHHRSILLLAVAFPALQQLLLHGQIGTLALVAVTLAAIAWQQGAMWMAGVALGSLAFKPQMGAIAACALLLRPGWRLGAGMLCGGLAQLLIVLVTGGSGLLFAYREALERVLAAPQKFEPKLWQMHSLRGAIDLVIGHGRLSLVVWLLCVGGVLWLAKRAIARTEDLRFQFAAIVLAGLLINPHLYVYDLVVLAVPLCAIAAWLIARGPDPVDRPIALTAFAVFWAPLLGPFAAVTHVQITSLLLVALLWQAARAAPHPSARPIEHDPLAVGEGDDPSVQLEGSRHG
jgi:hypothetical protein